MFCIIFRAYAAAMQLELIGAELSWMSVINSVEVVTSKNTHTLLVLPVSLLRPPATFSDPLTNALGLLSHLAATWTTYLLTNSFQAFACGESYKWKHVDVTLGPLGYRDVSVFFCFILADMMSDKSKTSLLIWICFNTTHA